MNVKVTKNTMTKKTDKKQLEDYLQFLKKQLESKNYKANVSKDEYDKEKAKYDKAKSKFNLLYGKRL